MTNKELSQSIRNELKKHGYSAKAVSVSVKDCLYSTSVRIKIKSPEISRKEIKQLLLGFEDYERDERTFEILEGGNTFVNVEYIDGLFDLVAQEWASTASGVLRSKDKVVKIFDGLFLVTEHPGKRLIIQQDSCGSCAFLVNSLKQLCEFIYKFTQFGSIAA